MAKAKAKTPVSAPDVLPDLSALDAATTEAPPPVEESPPAPSPIDDMPELPDLDEHNRRKNRSFVPTAAPLFEDEVKALVKRVKFREPAELDTNLTSAHERHFHLAILHNRVLRVQRISNPEFVCFVPFENIASYQLKEGEFTK